MSHDILKTGAVLADLPVHFSDDPAKSSPIVVIEPRKVCGAFGVDLGSSPRQYFIVNQSYSGKTENRGGHYHPDGGKREILFCLQGFAEVELVARVGDRTVRQSVPLGPPGLTMHGWSWKGLYIPNMVWHEVIIVPLTILGSVASTEYDPNEAVTDLPPGCA